MTAAFLRDFMPYGAPDLQEAERPHLVRALALGSSLAILLFAVAWSVSVMVPHPGSRMQEIIFPPPFTVDPDYTVMPPPPLAPIPIAEPSAAKSEVGVPQPVEDTPENLDKTLAPPGEANAPPFQGGSDAGVVPHSDPVPVGPINERGAVLLVDEIPAPVREVKPDYPDIAKQAGIEGLVIVDVLVGTDGRVLETHIDPRINVMMLNESALEAARKWVFTPAILKNQPVMAWIKLPFRYVLHE